jgi:WG containing repeat
MSADAQKSNYKVIVPFAEQEIVSINEKSYVVKIDGIWMVKLYSGKTIYTFSEDDISYIEGFDIYGSDLSKFLFVRYNDNKSRLFNLDILKYINPAKYDLYQLEGYYSNDQQLIRLANDEGKEGVMDWNGTLYLEPIYTQLYISKKNNLIIANNATKITAWDLSGNLLWSEHYIVFTMTDSKKQVIVRRTIDSLYGIVDAYTGENVFPFIYQKIYEGNNFVVAQMHSKFGMLNLKHEKLIDFNYKTITPYTGNLASASIDGKLFAVFDFVKRQRLTEFIYKDYDLDKNGNSQIYNAILELSTKTSPYIFEKDDKKGLINPNGGVLIPAIYDQISITRDSNIVEVWRDNNMGYYNIELNREIVPTQFDYTNYHGLGGGYPPIGDKDKISVISSNSDKELMGFYDIKGSKICDPIYDPLDYPAFMNNLCAVSLGGKYGLIDDNNRTIIPLNYDYIHYPDGNRVIVVQGVNQAIFEITK